MAKWVAYGRIDAHVQAAAEYLSTKQPYFEVKEIVSLVRTGIPGTRLRGLAGVLAVINRAAKDWEFDRIVTEYVQQRAREYLHQTKAYNFNKDKVEVRIFEHYQDAAGRHRWQPIQAMTADDLELCIVQRRRRIRQEEVRIDVYEALVTLLRSLPAGVTVGQVQDQILKAN